MADIFRRRAPEELDGVLQGLYARAVVDLGASLDNEHVFDMVKARYVERVEDFIRGGINDMSAVELARCMDILIPRIDAERMKEATESVKKRPPQKAH